MSEMLNSIILIFILVAIYYCIQNNKKKCNETFVDTDKIYFDDPYSLNDFSIPENNDPLKVSKKDMEYKICEMLIEETEFVGDWYYGPQNVNNPERQKFIKTIRKFLNFVLSEQK
jgi:hypothetical protein